MAEDLYNEHAVSFLSSAKDEIGDYQYCCTCGNWMFSMHSDYQGMMVRVD